MSDNQNQTKQKWRVSRQSLLLIFAAILFVGVFALLEFRFKRPIGEGPAGPLVQSAAFQDTWSNLPIQVIGLGDSITAGLGARSQSHTFFNRVIKNPRDEFDDMQGICLSSVFTDIEFENLAVSGSESSVHHDIIHDQLPTYQDRIGIVLMTSGGNDLIHSYGRHDPRECAMYGATLQQAEPWIENFRDRLRSMFTLISERFPLGCEIYIADIYDPTDGVGDAPSVFLPDWPDGLAIHARYNEVIRAVASESDHVHVVPLHRHFLGHGSHCRQFYRSTYVSDDPHYWFYSNIEDPNDRGYDAIRRVFLNTIVEKTTLKTN